MYLYQIFSERLRSEDVGIYTGYGIRVFEGECEVASVSDISENMEKVEKICRMCTQCQLDPKHFGDVIEDSI